MKRIRRSPLLGVILSLILVALPLSTIPGERAARAESKTETKPTPALHKISPDLQTRLQGRATAEQRVKVILQLQERPRGQLNALLNRNGVHISKHFESFNTKVVELPVSAVQELAGFGEVSYVSLDNDVQLLGHLETTTGAAVMRAMTGNSGLDGKDNNIAVIDSGIYKDHHGYSGIAAKLDFTGEGIVDDDPYGHGTHVAAMAAGNSHIASGAYTGIAPASKIINLRVLNSQGAGSVSSLLAALNWILAPTDPNKPAGEKNYQKYRIKVVNLSLGTLAVSSYRDDPLCRAVRRVVDTGIVVVAAAGNNGVDSSGNKIYGNIHSPGNEPSVITVGAVNTYGTDTRIDDTIATYSSRGPTRSYWTDSEGAGITITSSSLTWSPPAISS